MGDWLDGVERIPIPTVNGGTWVEDDPDRAVLHTTEGDTIEGAIATWKKTKVPSHLIHDAGRDRVVQCLPFNVSAYALKNLPGGVETNRVGRTIQIEIIGRSANSPDRPLIELQRIGALLRRVKEEGEVDFQYVSPKFVGPESGTIASVNAPQRMSQQAWREFNGVCGHQHVPENDHWDPGRIDIATIFASITQGEFDMLDQKDKDWLEVAIVGQSQTALKSAGLEQTNAKVDALSAKLDQLISSISSSGSGGSGLPIELQINLTGTAKPKA